MRRAVQAGQCGLVDQQAEFAQAQIAIAGGEYSFKTKVIRIQCAPVQPRRRQWLEYGKCDVQSRADGQRTVLETAVGGGRGRQRRTENSTRAAACEQLQRYLRRLRERHPHAHALCVDPAYDRSRQQVGSGQLGHRIRG